MKTRNLILLGAAAFAVITLNVNAALLTPHAAGNQIQHVSGTANDANLVTANFATVSPRAAGNQLKPVAGTNSDATPAAACAKNMVASPKAVQACIESGTMAGCKTTTVAALK